MNSFGNSGQYYAVFDKHGRAPQPDPRSIGARKALELLGDEHEALKQRIYTTYKRWNATLRTHIVDETALRLTAGDMRSSVPVRVVDGLPAPLDDLLSQIEDPLLWWLLAHQSVLERTEAGLGALEYQAEALDRRFAKGAHGIAGFDIGRVGALIRHLLGHDDFLALRTRTTGFNLDVLGAYFFRASEIHLYWIAIALFARILGVRPEALTLVTLAHELAHAYTHLGRDIDGAAWETEAFAQAELHVVEGLAQHYTAAVGARLSSTFPEMLRAFELLLDQQPEPYLAHLPWRDLAGESNEVVRITMLELRGYRRLELAQFEAGLRANAQRLPGRPRRLKGADEWLV